jgi:polyisoprenoid-binding protein YceI
LLTGRFNYFVLEKITFDETSPTSIQFEGYVRLNTVNTGEPGRDAGCLLTTYGTTAAKTAEPENLASIKSTNVSYSTTDAGYIATADLTFMGVTKSVTIKLDYVKQSHFDGAPGYTVAGFQGTYVFNAISDFGLVSTNISDQVTVRLDMLMRKKD